MRSRNSGEICILSYIAREFRNVTLHQEVGVIFKRIRIQRDFKSNSVEATNPNAIYEYLSQSDIVSNRFKNQFTKIGQVLNLFGFSFSFVCLDFVNPMNTTFCRQGRRLFYNGVKPRPPLNLYLLSKDFQDCRKY